MAASDNLSGGQFWFHGSSARASGAIIRSQKLVGGGDYGDGGYLTSSASMAHEYAGFSKRQVVAARLNPQNPAFGQDEGDRDDTNRRLRDAGHDVWFPDGTGPDKPGGLAVLLNEGQHGTAQFSALPDHVSQRLRDQPRPW